MHPLGYSRVQVQQFYIGLAGFTGFGFSGVLGLGS